MSVSINGTSGLTFNDASTQNTAATGFGFKNRIINGQMVLDQRNAGASVTTAGAEIFTLDRWSILENGSMAFSVQQSTTAPTGFSNSVLITTTTAASPSAATRCQFVQYVEGFNIADFGWGTASASAVTLSFWVRSSLTGTFGGALQNNAANRSYPFNYTISSANTFEYKTITIAGETSGTWVTNNGRGINLYFDLGMGSDLLGTAGAWQAADDRGATGDVKLGETNGATFYITGVQLEKGSTATSFDYRPYGTELQLCYRYYYKYLNDRGGATWPMSFQAYNSSSSFGKLFDFPVTMRSIPTCTAVGTFSALNSAGSITTAYTNVNIDYPTSQAAMTGGWTGSSGLTGGDMTLVHMSSGSYVQASAEL